MQSNRGATLWQRKGTRIIDAVTDICWLLLTMGGLLVYCAR